MEVLALRPELNQRLLEAARTHGATTEEVLLAASSWFLELPCDVRESLLQDYFFQRDST